MTPRATYRLQFNADFTFADAAALAPYLADLGISHLYASPWLKARVGSTHGYDIIDYAAFNPELGDEAGFEHLRAALKKANLGHILDFVPNHMGVAEAGNAWWLDLLEWGTASPYATYFDIDWTPTDPGLHHKVLLPFLGDHYGVVLERGELEPRFDPDSGSFSVWYFDHRFPLSPHTYATLIRAAAHDDADAAHLESLAQAAEGLRLRAGTTARGASSIRAQAAAFKTRLANDTHWHAALQRGAAALAVTPEKDAAWKPLHRLLERQSYRLAFWRVAADEINYRRFFDINALAALRVENPEVFKRIHVLVARLLDEGKLDGLRIDHVDGLLDPAQYYRRLRRRVRRPFYLVVEKILAQHEHLRSSWPIAGTTGYDFLNQVTGVLIDARSETLLTRTYQHFTGRHADFDTVLHDAKKQILRSSLSGELHVLARRLHRIARRQPRTRDYTLQALTQALGEVVAAFPVYRTYIDAHGADVDDRRDIARAVAQARKRWDGPGGSVFEFIESVLTSDLGGQPGYGHRRVLHLAMQFQQYTSPVMAKGLEDTAMYRYHRLLALNDVGGDPRRFGMSVTAFHRANTERARHWPQAMLTTATHDTKRGEDVRARLAALTQPDIAATWMREVRHWGRLNRRWKQPVHDEPAPDGNDEYLLYQTLIGAWPMALMEGDGDDEVAASFVERIQAYMAKALREAKQHSSWNDPDTDYEKATMQFIARLLDRDTGRLFLEAFMPLARRVAAAGVDNSLAQLALKLTCPGVPDIYQGGELWDLNLVDPDNRRAVDFAQRARLLDALKSWEKSAPDERQTQLMDWREHWHDGAIKMHVLRRLLRLRDAHPELFAYGDYRSLELPTVEADGAIAFERAHANERLVVAVLLRASQANALAVDLARVVESEDDGVDFIEVLARARWGATSAFDPIPVQVWLRAADQTAG